MVEVAIEIVGSVMGAVRFVGVQDRVLKKRWQVVCLFAE
jgi:hypothetical protein